MTAVPNLSTKSGYSREVDVIYRDCLRSLGLQKKWFEDAGKEGSPTVTGKRYSLGDLKTLKTSIEAHCRNLERVRKAGPQPRQRALAEAVILGSFHSHVCGLLRAHARCFTYIAPERLGQIASQSKQWPALTEEITAEWH